MSVMGGVYVCRKGYQPVCKGIDAKGELLWGTEIKQPWHQKMFPVTYGGDFCEQWMYKSLNEKGFEWDSQDFVEQTFVCKSRKLLKRIKR